MCHHSLSVLRVLVLFCFALREHGGWDCLEAESWDTRPGVSKDEVLLHQ